MSITSFVGDHTILVGLVMVISVVLVKFIIIPIMNEDRPIEPTEDDIKTFGEKVQESLNPDVNF